jgi:WD40 repeat protein
LVFVSAAIVLIVVSCTAGWYVRRQVQNLVSTLSESRNHAGKLERQLFIRSIELAASRLDGGKFEIAEDILRKCPPIGADPDERPWEWRYLAHCCASMKQHLSPLPTGRLLTTTGTKAGSLAFSPDNRWLAVRAGPNDFAAWDLVSGKSTRLAPPPTPSGPRAGLVFVDNSTLLSGCAGATLPAWDVSRGTLLERPAIMAGPQPNPDQDAQSVAIDPLGRRLATLAGAYRITTWDLVSGKADAPRQVEGNRITCLTMDLEGHVASGGDHGMVRLWPSGPGAPRQFVGLHRNVTAVGISPDGTGIAAVADDGSLCIWKTASGERLLACVAHSGVATGLIWNPDGLGVITCGEDGAVKFWDLASGEEYFSLPQQAGPIATIAISPNGAIRIWN